METDVGYQAWEILLKIPKPDLALALSIAQNLGFDIELMSELFPAGIQGIKAGLSDTSKDDFPKI